MSAQSKPSSCSLPVATTQLARGLIRLHARLRGELQKAADDEELLVEPEAAWAAMAHAEALIGFLGVHFEPLDIKPVRTRPRAGHLPHGKLRTEILVVLKLSGEWLTYREIAQSIITRNQLTLEPAQHRHFLQKLREAALALCTKGLLEREAPLQLGDASTLQRMRLSRRMFRPA